MKRVKTPVLLQFIALIALATSFSNCNKSNDAPPAPKSIDGLWVGSVSNATSSQFYSLSIKPDGKITFEGIISGQEQFGAGTWTLDGSDFSANVTTLYGVQSNIGVQQLLTAKFDAKTATLANGKYKNTNPANDSGTFILSKVE
jgi:hypothetical protein